MPRLIRRPTHSGSWYSDNPAKLSTEINGWMDAATAEPQQHARAIIAPHAGYAYCGRVMAYAYKQIDPSKVNRVFLLGPSHHAYLHGCALSTATHYGTPLGEMEIDTDMVAQLGSSGEFESMRMAVDEAEHSMEMHVPFIVQSLRGRSVKLVPILIGAISKEKEAQYGALLGPFLDDPGNLFVISSDFCHWGTRFSYTFYNAEKGNFDDSIEWLDRKGMALIEKADANGFAEYMLKYGNTICGKHPIGLFLQMLAHTATQHQISFRQYDQSSRCKSMQDWSVSYAAAVVIAI